MWQTCVRLVQIKQRKENSENTDSKENIEAVITLKNVVLSKGQKWVIQTTNGLAQTVLIEKIINSKNKEVNEIKAHENPTIICNVCSITEKGAYTHFLFLFFYVYIFSLEEVYTSLPSDIGAIKKFIASKSNA